MDVLLTTSVGTSSAFSLEMAPATPGIFPVNDPSDPEKRSSAVTLANTRWLAIPDSTSLAIGIPTNCAEAGIDPASFCGRPAQPNDPLVIFVTGLGKATPDGDPSGQPLETGSLAPLDGNPLFRTVDTPVVMVGDIPAEVQFSGLTPGFAGLYQINILVPTGVPGGDEVPIVVSMPNSLEDSRTIAIEP